MTKKPKTYWGVFVDGKLWSGRMGDDVMPQLWPTKKYAKSICSLLPDHALAMKVEVRRVVITEVE